VAVRYQEMMPASPGTVPLDPRLRQGQVVKVLKPNQRATTHTLVERNTSGREIARITGIARKTVGSNRSRWLEGFGPKWLAAQGVLDRAINV